MCTIAQQRHTLLCQVGESQLTKLSLGQRLPRLRIQDLRIEIVFIQVGTTLMLTLITHTRTGNLTQSVDIISLDTQTLLQFHTHLLRPGLSTEDTYPQLKLVTGPLTLLHRLTKEHGIRRRTAEHRRSEVVHQCHLLLGVTRRDGDHRGTDIRSTVVRSQTTGEQTIAISHLEDIIFTGTVCSEGT